jgi:protein-S-isoprenylcysteine O-methyltransferase Ste14
MIGHEHPETQELILGWARMTAVFILIYGVGLFLSAGRLDWIMAWAYLALFAINQVVLGGLLLRTQPELMAARSEPDRERARPWDRPLAGIASLFGPLSTLIVAGLDARFGWSAALPPAAQVIALGLAALSYALGDWAMVANRHFYGYVQINETGHTVTAGGPYRIIRHPGYAGGVLFALAAPLWLNSLWAYVPAALTIMALVLRTALEDRTLRRELDGYEAYARRVPYRLIPGIW